jgi:hypothetical protein
LTTPVPRYSDEDTVYKLTQQFDEARERAGGLTGDFGAYSPRSLNILLQFAADLTGQEPAFVEGYAFQVGAHVHRRQNSKAIRLAEPKVEAIFELIAKCAEEHKAKRLLMPYSSLPNRPFHRLAHGLVLAYLNSGATEKGTALADRMYSLWPNDNIGFRFLGTESS